MAQRRAGSVAGGIALAAACALPCMALAEPSQVYCSYRYYGTQYQMCLPPPVSEAKEACEAKAAQEHGEKLTCFCTDDPEYVGDFCKPSKPRPPVY